VNRKYEDRFVTSIAFERSVYDKLNHLLPKGVSITDEINEFLKQRLVDMEKESKGSTSNKGPIRIYENSDVKNSIILEQITEPTLDIYGSKLDLVAYVQKITDSKTAWTLKRNAKLLCELAETKAKELEKEHK